MKEKTHRLKGKNLKFLQISANFLKRGINQKLTNN